MKNITENNKLLVEFLGWSKYETFEQSEEYVLTLVNELNLKVGDFNIFGYKDMEFHNNWNWLMLVVDKIESFLADDFNVDIGYKTCSISVVLGNYYDGGYTENDGFDIVITSANKIEATYNACIDFVKWYNENK